MKLSFPLDYDFDIGDWFIMAEHTWDAHYDSPRADLILASKDGIGFKVDAWLMSKKCELIEKKLHPRSQEISAADVLSLDYSPSTIRLFIDLVYSKHQFPLNIAIEMYRELFRLSEEFKAPAIVQILSDALRDAMRQGREKLDPWEVFRLASQRDDFELARMAACNLQDADHDLGHLVLRQVPGAWDDVPQRYMAALARCAFTYQGLQKVGKIGPVHTWIRRSVEGIAEAFRLD